MKLTVGGNPTSFQYARSICSESVLTAQSSQKKALRKNKQSPYDVPYKAIAVLQGNPV